MLLCLVEQRTVNKTKLANEIYIIKISRNEELLPGSKT